MNTQLQIQFWNYSLNVYNRPDAKEACLLLQDKYHLNVNLLLFCCWFAESGRGTFMSTDLKTVRTRMADWNEDITMGLRRLRARLKKLTKQPAFKFIYSEALNTELKAEKIEQALIIEHMPQRMIKRKSDQQRAHDGLANLRAYFALTKTSLDTPGYQAAKTLFAHAFPQTSKQNSAFTS